MNTNELCAMAREFKVFNPRATLPYIKHSWKPRRKSVMLYFLLNITMLGAMAMSSRV